MLLNKCECSCPGEQVKLKEGWGNTPPHPFSHCQVIILGIHKATDNANLLRTEVKQRHTFTGHKSCEPQVENISNGLDAG